MSSSFLKPSNLKSLKSLSTLINPPKFRFHFLSFYKLNRLFNFITFSLCLFIFCYRFFFFIKPSSETRTIELIENDFSFPIHYLYFYLIFFWLHLFTNITNSLTGLSGLMSQKPSIQPHPWLAPTKLPPIPNP